MTFRGTGHSCRAGWPATAVPPSRLSAAWESPGRQAASQLIDTLVLRGYLSREISPEDRRRMDIVLTERGRTAAAAIRAAIGEVDSRLARSLSPADPY